MYVLLLFEVNFVISQMYVCPVAALGLISDGIANWGSHELLV
jgi:hypothetical protein